MEASKAGFLALELINEGVTMPEIIGQLLAGYVQSGGDVNEAIAEGAAGLNRFAELYPSHESNIWPELVPGGLGPNAPRWMVIEGTEFVSSVEYDKLKSDLVELEEELENARSQQEKMDTGQFGENEVLPYPLDYHHGDDVYHCSRGAEFFLDHQGHQWVKFFPMNGRDAGSEHMFRVVPTQDYVVRTPS